MYCVNHPSVETRVSCSACGDPICPDCMVFTAVGAKCPKCAAMPRSARVRVKPDRMLLTAIIGLAAAAVGGYAFGLLIGMSFVGFFAFIIAFGLGAGIGEAVSRASGRHHGPRLAAWAAACGALAVLFPWLVSAVHIFGVSALAIQEALQAGGIWKFLWMGLAGFAAWQRNA